MLWQGLRSAFAVAPGLEPDGGRPGPAPTLACTPTAEGDSDCRHAP